MKSHFHLRGSHPSIYFHVDPPWKERQKSSEARLELKAHKALISEMEVRRAPGGLNPHKGGGPDGLFPKVLKALNSHISSVHARMFNL